MNWLKDSWTLLYEAYLRFDKDDGFAMSGHIAYSGFLSIFPFAIFMTALAGILTGPQDVQAIVAALFELAPGHVVETLRPVIEEITAKDRGGVLTIAGIGAIWAASNALEALRVALDRAYDSDAPAGLIRRRVVAILFVFAAALAFAVLGLLIVAAPLMISMVKNYAPETIGAVGEIVVNVLRYVFGLAVFAGFLILLNRHLPSKRTKWKKVVPGITVATILWFVAATAFSIYLSYAPSYTVTYGAFAGVIITLLFFYITGAAIIFGAEVNAAIARRRNADVEADLIEEEDI